MLRQRSLDQCRDILVCESDRRQAIRHFQLFHDVDDLLRQQGAGFFLRIPFLHNLLALPGVPRAVAFVSRVMPRRPVRGPTSDYECDWEDCDVSYTANAAHYYRGIRVAGESDVQAAVQAALGRRRAAAELARLAEGEGPFSLTRAPPKRSSTVSKIS